MLPTKLTDQQLNEFHKEGYIILKNFCSKPEVDKLYGTACSVKGMRNDIQNFNSHPRKRKSLPLWFTPGNDIFGYLERSEKVVHSIAQLLGTDSPVCHIHSQLMEKQPLVGGMWEWHQNYAYWYQNNFMSADLMVSVMVALTPINKESGGSQIIKGSHKLGRINHNFEGDKPGADIEIVTDALKTMELVYPELEAGDALFFHSNLLHRALANLSGYSTWANISCYSSKSNLARKQFFTSWHTPVEIVPNEAIIDWCPKALIEKALLHKKVNALKKTVWGKLVAIS